MGESETNCLLSDMAQESNGKLGDRLLKDYDVG